MRTRTTYLLDANSFITPSRQYYAFDFASGFWRQFKKALLQNDVLLLDLVRDEITKGKNDELAAWLAGVMKEIPILQRSEQAVFQAYQSTVWPKVQECGYYTEKAIKSWAHGQVADIWLIAAALAHKGTIVTFEQSVGFRSLHHKTNKIKIPDVAKDVGVPCVNLFAFMRDKKIKWT